MHGNVHAQACIEYVTAWVLASCAHGTGPVLFEEGRERVCAFVLPAPVFYTLQWVPAAYCAVWQLQRLLKCSGLLLHATLPQPTPQLADGLGR